MTSRIMDVRSKIATFEAQNEEIRQISPIKSVASSGSFFPPYHQRNPHSGMHGASKLASGPFDPHSDFVLRSPSMTSTTTTTLSSTLSGSMPIATTRRPMPSYYAHTQETAKPTLTQATANAAGLASSEDTATPTRPVPLSTTSTASYNRITRLQREAAVHNTVRQGTTNGISHVTDAASEMSLTTPSVPAGVKRNLHHNLLPAATTNQHTSTERAHATSLQAPSAVSTARTTLNAVCGSSAQEFAVGNNLRVSGNARSGTGIGKSTRASLSPPPSSMRIQRESGFVARPASQASSGLHATRGTAAVAPSSSPIAAVPSVSLFSHVKGSSGSTTLALGSRALSQQHVQAAAPPQQQQQSRETLNPLQDGQAPTANVSTLRSRRLARQSAFQYQFQKRSDEGPNNINTQSNNVESNTRSFFPAISGGEDLKDASLLEKDDDEGDSDLEDLPPFSPSGRSGYQTGEAPGEHYSLQQQQQQQQKKLSQLQGPLHMRISSQQPQQHSTPNHPKLLTGAGGSERYHRSPGHSHPGDESSVMSLSTNASATNAKASLPVNGISNNSSSNNKNSSEEYPTNGIYSQHSSSLAAVRSARRAKAKQQVDRMHQQQAKILSFSSASSNEAPAVSANHAFRHHHHHHRSAQPQQTLVDQQVSPTKRITIQPGRPMDEPSLSPRQRSIHLLSSRPDAPPSGGISLADSFLSDPPARPAVSEPGSASLDPPYCNDDDITLTSVRQIVGKKTSLETAESLHEEAAEEVSGNQPAMQRWIKTKKKKKKRKDIRSHSHRHRRASSNAHDDDHNNGIYNDVVGGDDDDDDPGGGDQNSDKVMPTAPSVDRVRLVPSSSSDYETDVHSRDQSSRLLSTPNHRRVKRQEKNDDDEEETYIDGHTMSASQLTPDIAAYFEHQQQSRKHQESQLFPQQQQQQQHRSSIAMSPIRGKTTTEQNEEHTFHDFDEDDDNSQVSLSYEQRRQRMREKEARAAAVAAARVEMQGSFMQQSDVEQYRKSLESPVVKTAAGVIGAAAVGCVVLGPMGLLLGAAAVGIGVGVMQIPEEQRNNMCDKATEAAKSFQESACNASDAFTNSCAHSYRESAVAEHVPNEFLKCCATMEENTEVPGDDVDNYSVQHADSKENINHTNHLVAGADSQKHISPMRNSHRGRFKKNKHADAGAREGRTIPVSQIHSLDPSAQPRAWLDVLASHQTNHDEKIEAMEEILILAKDKQRARIFVEEGILDSIMGTIVRHLDKLRPLEATASSGSPPAVVSQDFTRDEAAAAKLAATCCLKLGKAYCAAIHTEGDLLLMSLYERGTVPEERQLAQMLHEVPYQMRLAKDDHDPTVHVDGGRKENVVVKQLTLPQAEDLAKSIKALAESR